ncbi:M56 family metallopeptidase [Aminipila terrae]|uniref:Uncharacterized protein n=1 Tax=Aminipila terrae TaxID=2697030 RepID=A0A6P1MHZ3_9FIRM|nr:hypothetical protein [Aminipila terrae]QHI73517.1 hypothetical protein Ami3637_15040 [Aminipila terrae]
MINTIISSSALIVIILIIRFSLKGKINPMLQYGLWSLVALRLAFFNLLNLHPIESALSVMNVAEDVTKTIQGISTAGQITGGIPRQGWTIMLCLLWIV